jgi:RimJ/RimL family protein N-acetyltransferase
MSNKRFSKRFPVLHTPRLTLRPLVSSDTENAIAIFQSDKVNATYMLPDFPTREDAVKLFDRLMTLSHGSEHLVLGIALGDSFIGFLNDTGFEDGMIEIGYALHPDYWNRGYATEALTAVIAELFRLGFSTVRAGFFEENPASGRVMEKSGMHRINYTDNIDYRGKTHRCIYYEIERA